MQTGDDILFTAPGPDFGTIPSATTEIVGTPGNGFNVYWIVTHFPIGSVLSGPFPQKDSPNVLDDENYIHISWLPAPGASSYDLLVTKDLQLPKQPGQFWLAGGLTDTEFRDTGQGLAFYDVAGIRFGAPQEEHVYFNNRDFKQPTLQFIPWPIQVSSIIFEDGSEQSTSGGAAAAPPNQSLQFNDNGSFGGSAALTWNGSELAIKDSSGTFGLFISNPGVGSVVSFNLTAGVLSELDILGDPVLIDSNSYTSFLRGSNEYMRIAANGNVGIGTQNPQSSLDVNGFIRSLGFLPVPTSGRALELYYAEGEGGTVQVVDRSTNTNLTLFLQGSDAGIALRDGIVDMSARDTIQMFTTSLQRMQIDSNGRVDITGSLYINGVQVIP